MSREHGYELLDCGAGRRLERVGGYVVDRQAPQAVWRKRLDPSVWEEADAVHHRSDKGGGRWEFRRRVPEAFDVRLAGLEAEGRMTPFGHLGFFPEHAANWDLLPDLLAPREEKAAELLHLFAYTGLGTLAAARANARVCHVDAAHGVVDWARGNAARNGLDEAPIRWIVDDARRFAAREGRRGRIYDALMLDPPSYGRGAKGQVWKIEDDLPALLATLDGILAREPRVIVLTCHTPGFTPIVLRELLEDAFGRGRALRYEGGELTVRSASGRELPSGVFCRALPRD